MLTERQRKILGILRDHSEGITSDALARHCGVSSKTVRNDLKLIGKELDSNIAVISASTRKGYTMEILRPRDLEDILLVTADPLQDIALRSSFMLKELLKHTLRDEPMTQQEMADMLYVGVSTLKIHLKSVKEALDKYNLKIINYKNQGMMVEGAEGDIRHAIYKYLFKDVEDRWEMRQSFPEKYDMTVMRQLVIDRVVPGYQLAKEPVEDVDLIISTIPKNFLPGISQEIKEKLVMVRHFLSQEEKDTIDAKLFSEKKLSANQIDRFFCQELFFTGKQYTNKEQVLNFLTDAMVNLGVMDQAAAASVREREGASPTEIGNLLAIPHPLENNTQVSTVGVLVL